MDDDKKLDSELLYTEVDTIEEKLLTRLAEDGLEESATAAEVITYAVEELTKAADALDAGDEEASKTALDDAISTLEADAAEYETLTDEAYTAGNDDEASEYEAAMVVAEEAQRILSQLRAEMEAAAAEAKTESAEGV